MQRTTIEVKGAAQNNLKNIDIEIPRDKLTVITGVSGSGKSSLAFDVIYGEAQRRFLDSVSNFAKTRIAQVKRPRVDAINGLSPVVAIEQIKGSKNPRSTIGTITDINDFMRLLFATAGRGHCPECGCELEQFTAAQMAERMANHHGSVFTLSTPIQKTESYTALFELVRGGGFKNVLIDGKAYAATDDSIELLDLDESADHAIELVVDKFTVKPGMYIQIAKSIDKAMENVNHSLMLKIEGGDPSFYKGFACEHHHYALYKLTPPHFSFQSDYNACPVCNGVGVTHLIEPRFLAVNPSKSISQGALHKSAFSRVNKESYDAVLLYSLGAHYGFDLDTPYKDIPDAVKDILLFGTKGEKVPLRLPPGFSAKYAWAEGKLRSHEGFVRKLQDRYHDYMRPGKNRDIFEPNFINEIMIEKTCPACAGSRLLRHRLDITVGGYNIDALCRMTLGELVPALKAMRFPEPAREAARQIAAEIIKRVQLLIDVGLHYLSLARRSDSISGGEMQRIKMSALISCELMGMLYVMDEPSIGLHPSDSHRVLSVIKRLRDLGNTVLVVEHDLGTMREADYLIELGPGSGINGGTVTAKGDYNSFVNQPGCITADYLSGRKTIVPSANKRTPGDKRLTIRGARANNLKNVTVDIPLGLFICVTGVSGSGKSTLIHEVLVKNLKVLKMSARIQPGDADSISGYEDINHVINVDQSPIGRGSKSNPATYVGLSERIRSLFAGQEEAVKLGYTALDFSLSHANGCRCEYCAGDGVLTTDLQYMADVESVCPVCKGRRFSEEGMKIKLNGKSIDEVLDMSVEEALEFFQHDKYLRHKLAVMNEFGLGYLKLGQRATTLSGGEAQRVKLSYELAKIKKGSHNLYILDEPTTGLHMADIQRMLDVINRLVDGGHTVIVIEHNIDVMKAADYIIDMGPEGGNEGGYVLAAGTQQNIAECESSRTGAFLA
jgi:excinuclease ABC subunit A